MESSKSTCHERISNQCWTDQSWRRLDLHLHFCQTCVYRSKNLWLGRAAATEMGQDGNWFNNVTNLLYQNTYAVSKTCYTGFPSPRVLEKSGNPPELVNANKYTAIYYSVLLNLPTRRIILSSIQFLLAIIWHHQYTDIINKIKCYSCSDSGLPYTIGWYEERKNS